MYYYVDDDVVGGGGGGIRHDLVKCFFCDITIGKWEIDDDPLEEHLKWSPECKLLNGKPTNNVPINEEQFKHGLPKISTDICGYHERERDFHPNAYTEMCALPMIGDDFATTSQHQQTLCLDDEPVRISTFSPNWPAALKQMPKQLAKAGLYYTNCGDRVRCFSCPFEHGHWNLNDDPLAIHGKQSPSCKFIIEKKKFKF